MKRLNTKKASARKADDLRPEYDLTRLSSGIRGKYYSDATAGTNLVLLEPELARVFKDSASVNRALRSLLSTAKSAAPRPAESRPSEKKRTPAAK